MKNCEQHLYKCLKLIANDLVCGVDCSSKTITISSGLTIKIDSYWKDHFVSCIQVTVGTKTEEIFTCMVIVYPLEFARVCSMAHAHQGYKNARQTGVFNPAILADLNDTLSDFLDDCIKDPAILTEMVA